MTHTPGPWEVHELIPDGHIIRKSGTYEIATDDYDVAMFARCGGPFRKLADAQLAAAAPELLEVAKLLVAAERASAGYIDDAAIEALIEATERAEAAIAKAEGEL